jgi:hypothetical protein
MSNEDVPIRPTIVEGSMIPEENDLPLTPEQRAFAEVVGREIARLWRDRHKGHSDVSQDRRFECRRRRSACIRAFVVAILSLKPQSPEASYP